MAADFGDRLTPSLAVIGANLFGAGVSDAETRSRDFTYPLARESAEPVAPPPHIAALIRQRAAAKAASIEPSPRPGLILRAPVAEAVPVLLDREEQPGGAWSGWLMGWELDYASAWDLILDARDQPYDPAAAMVQTWNPVRIDPRQLGGAVLGRLKPDRLAAVRALAAVGDINLPYGDQQPGQLRDWTLVGHPLLTGTRLGQSRDPRWVYRSLYRERALAITAACDDARHSWWQCCLGALFQNARGLGGYLAPEPVLALSGRGAQASDSACYRLGDTLRLRVFPDAENRALQFCWSLLAPVPATLSLWCGAALRQQVRLTPEEPEADLFAGAGQGLRLRVTQDSGAMLLDQSLDVPFTVDHHGGG